MAGGHVRQASAVEVLATMQPSGVFDEFAMDSEGRASVGIHPGALLALVFPLGNGTWAQENAAGDPQGSHAVFNEPKSAAWRLDASALHEFWNLRNPICQKSEATVWTWIDPARKSMQYGGPALMIRELNHLRKLSSIVVRR
ncbi:hypothetical protein B0H19DRAFT_1073623 [Mycena capillaripes]|nr:hypothetical protein B0H19DRAFT_1073623 [Mycena capillaripes]